MFTAVNPLHPGYIAGRRVALTKSPASSTAIAAVDTIYFLPFFLYAPLPFTALSAHVTVGGAASSMKTGVWANSPVSMRPLGAPLFADNTGVATATGATSVNNAVGAGTFAPFTLYWTGAKFTGTLPSLWAVPNTSFETAWLVGVAGGVNTLTNISIADAYANALPTFAEGAAFVPNGNVSPMFWAVT